MPLHRAPVVGTGIVLSRLTLIILCAEMAVERL